MATKLNFGLVINKINYATNDEIVMIWSKNQIINLISLGTKKITSKNRFSLQIGNFVEIEYFQSRLQNKMSKLKKSILIKSINLFQNENANILFKIMQLINRLKICHENLFFLLFDLYDFFDEYSFHVQIYFIFHLLNYLGLQMNLTSCADCDKKDQIIDFNFKKGGFLCEKHSINKKSFNFLNAIKNLIHSFSKFKLVDSKILDEIWLELNDYLLENIF